VVGGAPDDSQARVVYVPSLCRERIGRQPVERDEGGERRARALPSLVSSACVSDLGLELVHDVALFVLREGRTLVLLDANPVPPTPAPQPTPVRVQVGIDAAIVANHLVCVRSTAADGTVTTSRFLAAPTLAGLTGLSARLADYPQVQAVVEPTSMTWLPLAIALDRCGGRLACSGPGTPPGYAARSPARTSPT
jgi:hypothetical protein